MSLGRRKVELAETSRWVFNRMADVYDARPPYPAALVDTLAEMARAGGGGGPVLEVGAGIGHLALPLAARGLPVTAVEPAMAMLRQLERGAAERRLDVRVLHGAAEALPVESRSIGLAVIADALHFLDAERAGAELARVLVAGEGGLAVVTCAFADTPFMRGVARAMERAVPRRPRPFARALVQLAAMSGVSLGAERHFVDETTIDHPTLERILRSISFIGPAMNEARFAAFRDEVVALAEAPVWARRFTLRAGRAGPSRRALLRAARAARGDVRSPTSAA